MELDREVEPFMEKILAIQDTQIASYCWHGRNKLDPLGPF